MRFVTGVFPAFLLNGRLVLTLNTLSLALPDGLLRTGEGCSTPSSQVSGQARLPVLQGCWGPLPAVAKTQVLSRNCAGMQRGMLHLFLAFSSQVQASSWLSTPESTQFASCNCPYSESLKPRLPPGSPEESATVLLTFRGKIPLARAWSPSASFDLCGCFMKCL